jgi:nucleoside phosphorylase
MTGHKDSNNLARLCLVTAVDIEFKTATGLLTEKNISAESKFKICHGMVGNRAITVLQCGIGARGFAEWLTHHLAENRYDALIVAGLAGALDPRLKTGDAVVYDCCLDAREAIEEPSPQHSPIQQSHKQTDLVRALLDALRGTELNSFYGSGITVCHVVINAQDKLWLGQQHQALAVDMESFDVLQVAAKCDVPAVVVRVISDETAHDLPDFNSATDTEGTINPRQMATAMLQRPVASARFLRNLKPVLAALRKVMEVVVRV